jgi:predicted Zn-dependent protease
LSRPGRPIGRLVREKLAAVRACGLLAGAAADPAGPVRLVRELLAKQPGNADLLYLLALSLCRAEKWQQAIEAATAATKAGTPLAWRSWPVLALAEFRRGDAQAARAWLDRATRWSKQQQGPLMDDTRLEFQILYAEALALVGADKP